MKGPQNKSEYQIEFEVNEETYLYVYIYILLVVLNHPGRCSLVAVVGHLPNEIFVVAENMQNDTAIQHRRLCGWPPGGQQGQEPQRVMCTT